MEMDLEKVESALQNSINQENESNPLVGVWMITHQHENFIANAIESVLSQEVDFDIEIVIGVDKCSDATRQIVEGYEKKYPNVIKPIYHKSNVGGTKNSVSVLRKIKGEFIAFLEGDDIWENPKKLKQQVDYLKSNKECILCGGLYRMKHGDNFIRDRRLSDIHKTKIYDSSSLVSFSHSQIHTSTFLVRKSLFDSDFWEWEGFNESPSGDIYILFIASLLGKIVRLPELYSCRNVVHESSLTRNRKKEEVKEPIMKTLNLFNSLSQGKYLTEIEKEKRFWDDSVEYRNSNFSMSDAFYLIRYKKRLGISIRDIIYILRKGNKI
jgi:glycosyltransferase involved in cell wall biosynthesis